MGLLDTKAASRATQRAGAPLRPTPPSPAARETPEPVRPAPETVTPGTPTRRPDDPDPARAGLVRWVPGEPFVHYCAICGAWGAFGFGVDLSVGRMGAGIAATTGRRRDRGDEGARSAIWRGLHPAGWRPRGRGLRRCAVAP
jgi:hypothetical protein